MKIRWPIVIKYLVKKYITKLYYVIAHSNFKFAKTTCSRSDFNYDVVFRVVFLLYVYPIREFSVSDSPNADTKPTEKPAPGSAVLLMVV